jgi:hypothetical protein
MPACCSPSDMPEGSGRNLSAPQAGAAFWAGDLVAASAVEVARLSAKLVTTANILLIITSPISAETRL